jgi:hypothetical protein
MSVTGFVAIPEVALGKLMVERTDCAFAIKGRLAAKSPIVNNFLNCMLIAITFSVGQANALHALCQSAGNVERLGHYSPDLKCISEVRYVILFNLAARQKSVARLSIYLFAKFSEDKYL